MSDKSKPYSNIELVNAIRMIIGKDPISQTSNDVSSSDLWMHSLYTSYHNLNKELKFGSDRYNEDK